MEYLKSLSRKKPIGTNEEEEKGKLKRALTLLDLTGLGVGSTLGLGVYVLAGSVAKNHAGPAVVISFLIAAIASAFAGICYAEFASRVPKAGSAYTYSYVTIGEFVAFVIGWNLLLEYLLGSAGVARGLSNYIDSLSNFTMKDTLRETLPIDAPFLASYPDFLSFTFLLILTGILSFGVKESTILNNLLVIVNLTVIAVVIVSGAMNADPGNWTIPKEKIEPEYQDKAGAGGFLPFGFSGVMIGAAKCFFGFVGFDCVATTGEEAKNPRRNIPLSIVLSMIIIFSSYFGISCVLTMMYPYYLQDADAPFPFVFQNIGWIEIKWVVTIGAIFALCTTMLGAMFPLPRIFYAMGKDGLIFKQLAKVNKKTQTPLIATVVSGITAGLMAMLFDLDQLIDMMSIATLLAYTIVAMCVLILRYEEYPQSEISSDKIVSQPETGFQYLKKIFKISFNLNKIKRPTEESSQLTKWAVIIFTLFSVTLCAIIAFPSDPINEKPIWAILFAFNMVILLVLMLVISRQPSSSLKLNFKVPLVPLIPCLSIIINIYLMLILHIETWIRFCFWLAIGFAIYFFYGHKNSVEAEGQATTNSQSEGTA
ncbi:UNVERIFIED_CONTAM: hypothetical protein PYX00_010413 [Menopon gallinae]|uniref:Cationic amino acid transporter C-terminal domain-containing protein n=1 Tax=Menopon gallinae TaxID=328185 RepID=A0AAW2HFE3_9NEOP